MAQGLLNITKKSLPLPHMLQIFCCPLIEIFRNPWQMLLFAGTEIFLNLTYAWYLFINRLRLDVIAISKKRWEWNSRAIFTKITP